MMLAFPGQIFRTFYKRAIAALCVMVLFPKRYIVAGTRQSYRDITTKPHYQEAAEIAKLTAKHFLGMKTLTYNEFQCLWICSPGDYRDPGEQLTLGTELQEKLREIGLKRQGAGDIGLEMNNLKDQEKWSYISRKHSRKHNRVGLDADPEFGLRSHLIASLVLVTQILLGHDLDQAKVHLALKKKGVEEGNYQGVIRAEKGSIDSHPPMVFPSRVMV
ncbi:hypothetical protein GYMLUDRAFT_60535 [Collybiopsis luxurians FD-317 M1]|uniref:Uncharacterized protein n=1 Tax=Collybiopsis luxurians FD-317 M1 TaxID=944289 RepID=A0A0D0CK31_9AGAR|nr:hypothetical protein GYMLUDRAFT_60535 [Collybiopsis luxurians FD-317 M1]